MEFSFWGNFCGDIGNNCSGKINVVRDEAANCIEQLNLRMQK